MPHWGPRVRRRSLTLPILVVLTAAGCRPGERGRERADVAPDTPSVPGAAVVEHHVDGDTIDVLIGGREERVRLTGIDTPEVAHESNTNRPGNAAECFGDAAAAHMVGLLPLGTDVRLVRDVVARDDYGRLLAYIYRLSDELFINEVMVRDGFAQPLTIAPNVAYSEKFVSAARAAEAEDIGLWSACAAG
jgi:micrococcal nuclease